MSGNTRQASRQVYTQTFFLVEIIHKHFFFGYVYTQYILCKFKTFKNSINKKEANLQHVIF